MEKTTKEIQKVARENGFYLCPIKVWESVAKTIDSKDSEIKRVKKERENWRKKYFELKNDKQ